MINFELCTFDQFKSKINMAFSFEMLKTKDNFKTIIILHDEYCKYAFRLHT